MDEAIVWINLVGMVCVVAYWLMLDKYAKVLRELHELLKDWSVELRAEAEQVRADAETATDYIVTALWHLEGKKDQ